jgi:WD40 repeat protein
LAGGQRLERFRAEAEAVAQLQHPNIVAIYSVGEHKGAPFFSMEYVPGHTLAEVVSDRPLPPQIAARYVRDIAEAVEYAHQRGILHRDLKPSNVLIDGFGRLRVTDFGLAKRLSSPSSLSLTNPHPSLTSVNSPPNVVHSPLTAYRSQLTITGQVLGSPSYLAPEQVAEGRAALGPCSDIYALGAILFHLLTGRPPFLSETLEGTLLQVLTTEPIGVRRLNPAVPRDLETICWKCLQKEPGRRYNSAQELADELERFLNREPIHAHPANALEKGWRWCQRRPALAAILGLLLLSFAAGLGGVLWEWRRARESELSLERNLYATDVNLAQVALEDNNLGRVKALLERHIPKSKRQADLRGFEWHYLWSRCRGDEEATLPGIGGIVSCVRFSPTGRLIASAGFDQTVTIWDAERRQALAQLRDLKGPVCRLGLSFSNDGKLLAAASGTDLVVWKTEDWSLVQRLAAHSAPLAGGAYQVLFTLDDTGLAVRLNEDLHLIDTANWHTKMVITGAVDETASLMAYSMDGKILATFNDQHVCFRDAATGQARTLSTETISQPFGLAFAPGGELLAVVDATGKLRLLDFQTGSTARSVQAHKGFAQAVAFAPDGKTLVTCGTDQLVRLWDFATLTNIATLKGHQSEVWSICFSPDGGQLASASKDGTVKLWSAKPRPSRARTLDSISTPMWFSSDSKTLLTKSSKGSLSFWDVETGRQRRMIPPLQTGAERYYTTVSADGKYLATSVEDGRVFLWNLESGNCFWTNRVDVSPANALAFSPNNRQLALLTGQYVNGAWRGGVLLLDLTTGNAEKLSSEFSGTRDTASVVFSPDGKLLAWTGPNYSARLWDLASGKERAVLNGHAWSVTYLAFSPNGKLLASGGNDNTARIWDVETGVQIASLTGHKTGVVQLAFTPDGRTLVTSGNDMTVRLWSVATHRELLTLRPATRWTHFLFSPDGQMLATGGIGGPLELWAAK